MVCNHCLIGKPFSTVFRNEYWANLNNDQGQRDFSASSPS